ncbi:diguanylate cyclase domain-containing protein [Solicola sp. PLA-1-18]|uniref:diguanylate cyclase domain-containing protein n=1 Tax=Solicola sp. PLA-1-18 TaxID=3380532 RepID=UPI003B7AE486
MIGDLIRDGGVRSVYQPIVRLETGEVVGYEALARGPEGPLAGPLALFSAATEAGCLAELDAACRAAAMHGAVELGLAAPLTLFVNIEPEVLNGAALDQLMTIADGSPSELRVVLEITERALASRPAELLQTVGRVKELGWRVALDDVGAEPASLAFMPLLRPDVVKLDLRLVQQRPGPAVAEIMNAVNAYAERSGAVLLAEGIEDEQHLQMALGLGATVGQGWMFGRPAATLASGLPTGELVLTDSEPDHGARSPFECLPVGTALRRSPKSLLIEVSKQLEREAMRAGETCVVTSTFQERRHFTPATVSRYLDLVRRVGFVCAVGEGLSAEPAPGVRGADLALGDPVRHEWDVVVLGPHFAAALLARDLGDTGPDRDRMFEYALTYDRETVVSASRQLLARVRPRSVEPAPATTVAASVTPCESAAEVEPAAELAPAVLHRALAATSNGVAIADMLAPDYPLIYVNRAFELLSGVRATDLLGRNCRFMQGEDTDRGAVRRLAEAIERGEEARETIVNYRGPQQVPWWNEVHLSPVHDDDGRVVQYIGVQNDVTDRVEAERRLRLERERATRYLDRIETIASTDPLTGLLNRRRLEERVEAALLEAAMNEQAVALLYLDLDQFKPVNDTYGHAVGDQLLQVVARRLRSQLRHTDLLARLGGDEFLIALIDLDARTAQDDARRIAELVQAHIAQPVVVGETQVTITTSVGISISNQDGNGFGPLLHLADLRMYDSKHPVERIV